jgi:hypothetical protein
MSNIAFLPADWPDLHESAVKAEALANGDARALDGSLDSLG